jgi:acyl-CoA thioesterase FadM
MGRSFYTNHYANLPEKARDSMDMLLFGWAYYELRAQEGDLPVYAEYLRFFREKHMGEWLDVSNRMLAGMKAGTVEGELYEAVG